MVHYVANAIYGDIYGRQRTVEVTRRLRLMPTAKAGILEDSDGVHLFSYCTNVLSITKDGWLSCYGLYGPTTAKHIGRFLREVAPKMTYFDAKRAYRQGVQINVYTREERPEVDNVTYNVTNYFDVWGNVKDGYTVNDSCGAGTLSVPYGATDKDLCSALKRAGILASDDMRRIKVVDMGGSIEITRKDGYPLFGLQPIE